MATEKASVAHAKNTLSSLINKVAYGKARVVLESRGKPKAALISTEDLEKLERLDNRAAARQRPLNILLRAQVLRGKTSPAEKITSRLRGTLGSIAGSTRPWNLRSASLLNPYKLKLSLAPIEQPKRRHAA